MRAGLDGSHPKAGWKRFLTARCCDCCVAQIRTHFRFAFGNFTRNAEIRKVAFGPLNPYLLQIVYGVWLASPRCLFKSWNMRPADREGSVSVTKLSF